MSSEIWLPVTGYEGFYEVSNQGRVRSLLRRDGRNRMIVARMPSIHTHPSGHKIVKLSRDGAYQSARVHRLVAIAFKGAPPAGCEVLHGDGDPGNNRVENLRWGTRSENIRDSVRHGTHHWANKTECPQGHAYDSGNTHVTSDGRRMCRECLRVRNRITRQRKRQNA